MACFIGCLGGAAPALAQSSAPALQTTDQVSVTADRSAVPLGATAKTVYTIDPQALHDSPALTLDESLRQHAGFELFRRAPSRIANPTSEGISLRGLGSTAASRTLVLENGAPLNDPFGGWIHWNEDPQQTVDRVELVTGGGSDLYGSSALGGVIDVIPQTAGEVAGRSPAAAQVSAAGGSEDTSNLQATLAARVPLADGLLAAETLRTAGYVTTAPSLAGAVDTPANVRSEAYRAEAGRREQDASRSRYFLTGNVLNENRRNGTPLQTNATRLWRYLAGYDTPANGNVDARIRLFGSDEGYRQSFSSIAANRDSESLTRLQRVHTDELGGTLDGTIRWKDLALVGGADVRDLRGEDNETPIASGQPNGLADVTARQRFTGGFGELLGQHGNWSGAFSLRADRASNFDVVQASATANTSVTRHNLADRTEIVVSPRLGMARALGAHGMVHASVFRAFRSPTQNELYRTGQVGQEITQANASLVSERGTGFEVGGQAQTAGGRLDLQATYFWTEINRPVSAVLITQTATTITNLRENLGQIRSQGIEASLTVNSGHALSFRAGYQFADAVVTKFSAQPALVGLWIPEVPRESLTAQLRAQSKRLGELTLAARASGRAYDDASNLFPLAGFFEMDVSGRRDLGRRLAAGRMDVFFVVQNLTNQRQQVARTPILTLGTPIFGEAGLHINFGGSGAVTQP